MITSDRYTGTAIYGVCTDDMGDIEPNWLILKYLGKESKEKIY